MKAYVAGDAEAFERLFRALAPSIHGFFVRSVGRGPAAEDLLQATFLKIHGARSTWRGGEKLRAWAFTIAGRVRVDWLRRNRVLEDLDDEVLADPAPRADPAGALLARERADRVRDALERLPEPQRVIVHLHRLEDLGFAEIGRILGITESAAKLRAFRAYARLREMLADLVEDAP